MYNATHCIPDSTSFPQIQLSTDKFLIPPPWIKFCPTTRTQNNQVTKSPITMTAHKIRFWERYRAHLLILDQRLDKLKPDARTETMADEMSLLLLQNSPPLFSSPDMPINRDTSITHSDPQSGTAPITILYEAYHVNPICPRNNKTEKNNDDNDKDDIDSCKEQSYTMDERRLTITIPTSTTIHQLKSHLASSAWHHLDKFPANNWYGAWEGPKAISFLQRRMVLSLHWTSRKFSSGGGGGGDRGPIYDLDDEEPALPERESETQTEKGDDDWVLVLEIMEQEKVDEMVEREREEIRTERAGMVRRWRLWEEEEEERARVERMDD
jgi:hypothetical protein